jgi:hypothetical protein
LSWMIAGNWPRRSAASPSARCHFPLLWHPSGVSLVWSCRAEVTDSSAGCCGNCCGAECVARAGHVAFSGEA